MKIGMILAYENNPYAGVVRPFINWAKMLNKMYVDVEFLVIHVSKEILDAIDTIKCKSYSFKNIKDLVDFCNIRNYEYIMIDDYIRRLNILQKLGSKHKIIVYVQILYGTHNIFAIFKTSLLRWKIIYSVAKYIPFTILRKKYVKLFENADYIIANSQFTASLLYLLYNIRADGIVYPPVDDEIFTTKAKKDNAMLVYLGSYAGDTEECFIEEIITVLRQNNIKIFLMGNPIIRRKLKDKFNDIEEIYNLTDNELAKIYSRCRLVICPQIWEQFGYVAAESILCETPVLAFNYNGISEIIKLTKFGFLANNKKEFLKFLEDVDTQFALDHLNKEIIPFTNKISTQYLLNIIRS